MYTPPFSISAEAVNLIAEISAQMERYAIRLEQTDGLRLRKVNRIKTIHSSLAIEGNTLSEGEVRDIIDGKNVVAPLREIQEVRNAIRTYELFPQLDPFSERDLLRAHGVMMEALVDGAGRYRRGGVGVYGETGLVHLAPPADRVPFLMGDLFQWLKQSPDHLLIRSCVFHYEFEFIHPFLDGNGRTGRLWQSLILSRLHPLFAHLPVENMVHANQQAYYDAITASTRAASSGPFIDFMLGEILRTLRAHQGATIVPNKVPDKVPNKSTDGVPAKLRATFPDIPDMAWSVYVALRQDGRQTTQQLADRLGISDRMVRKHIAALKARGLLVREGSNKAGRWKVVKA